ncbi:hypothetical protein ACPA9J_02115 [Pseudomonas aeruginosa]
MDDGPAVTRRHRDVPPGPQSIPTPRRWGSLPPAPGNANHLGGTYPHFERKQSEY